VITVVITVAVRLWPVAMLLGDASVDPSAPCPDPSHEKRREGEELRPGPPPRPSSSCTMDAPEPTHSLPQPSQHPPSTPPRPPCTVRPSHVARAPKPASSWTPAPSSLRPINTPADQTERLAPSPATPQTHSLRPACSSSTTPAPPARYWTWRAPPRSTTWEQAAAGNRRRSITAADSARRRRVLLPLRHALAVEQSSLQRR
jgi:hypothetical protein